MNLFKRTHRQSGLQTSEMQEYLDSSLEIKHEIQENIEKFGTPFLRGSSCGHRRESLARELEKLLYEELPGQLAEVTIRPENAEGHHWEIEHHLLAPDASGKLVRASNIRRKRRSL